MLIPVIEPIIEPRTSHAGEETSPVVSSVIEPVIEANPSEIEDIAVEPVIDPVIIPEIVTQTPNNEGKTAQQESVFLPSVPPDTWVNFPASTLAYNGWRIYLNNLDVSDTFLVRDDNGNKQIRSSLPYSNLKFFYYV